jgi:hypothetical protein
VEHEAEAEECRKSPAEDHSRRRVQERDPEGCRVEQRAGEAVAPVEGTPASAGSNPELEQALATEKDSYGIPQGMYSIDFELDAFAL